MPWMPEGACYSGSSVFALDVNDAVVAGLYPQSAPNVLGYALIYIALNRGIVYRIRIVAIFCFSTHLPLIHDMFRRGQ